mmetsp:Transcript_19826/g.55129  ORF Transcript_19826/g.55129 Transcript_19826/m.55129 type:complete len:221 (-) Transcript_19826:894-1556(-)
MQRTGGAPQNASSDALASAEIDTTCCTPSHNGGVLRSPPHSARGNMLPFYLEPGRELESNSDQRDWERVCGSFRISREVRTAACVCCCPCIPFARNASAVLRVGFYGQLTVFLVLGVAPCLVRNAVFYRVALQLCGTSPSHKCLHEVPGAPQVRAALWVSVICAGLLVTYAAWLRARMARRLRLPGKRWHHFLCWFCCGFCALWQETRTVQRHAQANNST